MAGLKPQRAVIIGAGIGGLSAGAMLAQRGCRVTVLEQHSVIGGLLQRFRRGSATFDTGFHFATGAEPGGILRSALRVCGVREEPAFIAADPRRQFTVHLSDGQRLSVPQGFAATLDSLVDAFPDQADAMRRFLRRVRAMMARSGLLSRYAPDDDGEQVPVGEPHAPVSEHLRACGVQGQAAAALGLFATIIGLSAQDCPFEHYAAITGTALAGSYRLAGGGAGLTEPLRAVVEENGGHVRTRCGLASITTDGRHLRSVIDVHGEEHPCDVMIASCHPQELIDRCGAELFRPSTRSHLEDFPDSTSAMQLFATCATAPAALGASHHLILDEHARPHYAVAPGNFDPAAGPLLELLTWVPGATTAAWTGRTSLSRDADYETCKAQYAEQMWHAVQRCWPDLHAQRQWTGSPTTIQHYVRARSGAAFGLDHSTHSVPLRPLSVRTRLRNVFLAGHSLSHPGVLGTLLHSLSLCGHILGRDVVAAVAAEG